ncbi:DEAD/DEAH box helicase domain protein [Leptothrix cholodnii SP-6]|uniref:DEAD/DEAH box helicase domain protein n=1 Tax=Leptothrix cholodnii (strain ATCC 51168 / LMG 8142 / SP-6) TaxID=395495 RepID=B1Y168_LEPCP|nr:DEAD/DEAH box helicase [Leptothrix cholodnii]ACB33045.1 DEAD/DEAH box helicase domain protein [Leptothrix cholodnii SP-6]
MFDADTSALISSAPELEGLDLPGLPEQLTDAYTSIVTARVRLRELAVGKALPADIDALATQMRRIAFTNEAFVSALPNRENRASAAFVAGAAHHVSLMAARLGRTEQPETRLTLDSIAPEVSATLLFMVAEATADSAEMAKTIVIPSGNIIEGRLLNAIVNLSKGELINVSNLDLPSVDLLRADDTGDRGVAGLLYLLLRGVRQLARELLGTPQTDDTLGSAASVFRRIKDLCVERMEIAGESTAQGDCMKQTPWSTAAFSAFPGPHHLASLLMSVADNLAPAAVVNVTPPGGVDGPRWATMMRKIAKRRPYLWRNHRTAVDSGYLETGTSSAVSFPTGAGKSTLSELKIAAMLLQGKKVIFLAPTLALVEQTASALKVTFPEATVQQERGENFDFEDFVGDLPSVSVMTTERCLALLGYESEAFSDVGLLVFDECHLLHAAAIEASHRAVDAMLCVLNFVTIVPTADLLLLSAMMKNTGEIAAWIASMTGRPCLALDLTWKPTRQVRGCVVYEADHIETLNARLGTARATAKTKGVPTAVAKTLTAQPLGLFSLRQTWLSKSRAHYRLLPLLEEKLALGTGKSPSGKIWYLTPNGNKLASALAVATASQNLKTLVFVQTIPLANAATKAVNGGAIATEITLTSAERALLTEAIEELGDVSHSYVSTNDAGRVEAAGVCHHSLLLHAERQLHESLFRRSDGVKVMVATSTLAQGMNLPSEVVIIGGDSRFDREANKVQRLEAHELLNAAGRAGRAGESSYGFVLVVPSKVVHFRDGKNEIGKHWADLQTIFAQSDQCVAIDDPMTALLDQLELSKEDQSASLRYLLSRLPVGEDGDKDSAARALLQKSFAAYRKRAANDLAWIDSRVSAALAARKVEGAPTNPTWVDRLAAATGVSAELISQFGQAVSDLQLPNAGSVEQWRDSFLEWLKAVPQFVPYLIRPSTLDAVLGKPYKALTTDAERGRYILDYATEPLKRWMAGSIIAEIELTLGTNAAKLCKCDLARDFVLRIVPELAFVFGLPLQVVRAIKKGTEQEKALPGLGLSTLSGCVRGGFDVAEKLALRQALNVRSSRTAVHKRYASLHAAISPATSAEDFGMAVGRLRNALSTSR